jgi:hypothetical protein
MGYKADAAAPTTGDRLLYRETEVRPGLRVEDRTHPASAVHILAHADGRYGVYLCTDDLLTMRGLVPRWRPAKAEAGEGTYGWCWPHEADLPPMVPAS